MKKIGIYCLVILLMIIPVFTYAFDEGDGTQENPYVIKNWTNLNEIRNNLDKYFILNNNIDKATSDYYEVLFSGKNYKGEWSEGHGSYSENDLVLFEGLYWQATLETSAEPGSNGDWAASSGWLPIGDVAVFFVGNFDGNNKKISDLYIKRGSTQYVGLFGNMAGNGVIKDLLLGEGYVAGNTLTGGLVGKIGSNCLVDNVASEVEVLFQGSATCGGLVGENNGTINNSTTYGAVRSFNLAIPMTAELGGLVGANVGSITNSCSYSEVTATGVSFVGGLAGGNYGTIEKSCAKGNIKGDTLVGGFVGNNGGTIQTSYANGNVEATLNSGGFVGQNFQPNVISNCYATGNITRTSGDNNRLGPFAGYSRGSILKSYSIGSVTYLEGESPTDKGFLGRRSNVVYGDHLDDYFDMETSGQTSSEGGGVVGKTTAQMKSIETYSNWDISINNSQHNNGYPYLSMGGDTVWYIHGGYNVNYSLEGNGTIEGETEQNIKYGEDGSEVLAVPNPGFYFSGWNNGNKEASRRETSVRENKNIVAKFLWLGNPKITSFSNRAEKKENQNITLVQTTTTTITTPSPVATSIPQPAKPIAQMNQTEKNSYVMQLQTFLIQLLTQLLNLMKK